MQAGNTSKQRMMWPKCEGEVTSEAMRMKDGDSAGICALQGCYGCVGLTKELNTYYLVMMAREQKDMSMKDRSPDYMPGTILEKFPIESHMVRLKVLANFEDMHDFVEFYYFVDGAWVKIGKRHQLYFRLDHFVGCRFGLFIYATKEVGGEAIFQEFRYRYEET